MLSPTYRWLCFWLLTVQVANAQSGRSHQYHLEAGTLLASDQTPFWLRANQYGIVPLSSRVFRLQGGLRADYKTPDSTGKRPKLDWGYALDAVANVGASSDLLLPEAHVKGRFGALELYVGRRREIVGLVDTLLTTGSYAWSGNTLPIPKIQLGFHQFTPVPFTKGVLSFMGVIAHGWFGDQGRLVKESYLHQKYLYGRLGKPTWPFRLYGGFNHQVAWSGYALPGVLSNQLSVNGRLPTGIQYFPAVFLGDRGQWDRNDANVTSFEDNRIGNHLGTIDVAADVNLNHWNLYIYRQFLYDDGSLFYGTNLADGLNGIRLKNRRAPTDVAFSLRQVSLEFLYTESQGGDEFIIDNDKRRGRDDYFNHGQFVDGWTYRGQVIGSPFMTPARETIPTLPQQRSVGVANNRVSVGNVAAQALINGQISVTTRLSVSRNLGTYIVPYPNPPMQLSGLLSAAVPVPWFGGTMVSGSVGVDAGGLLPNSVGVYVGLRKTGVLGRATAL